MFKHKVIPQQANYNKLNNYIDLSGSHFYIPEKNAAWEPITVREKKIPRRAGVSSFGFGGTNAHIILEEFVAADNPARLSVRIPYHLIVLSAKSKHALQQKSRDLLSYIISDQPDLKDLAFTLSNGRSHFIYRHAWIVSSIDQLVTSIETLPATLFDTQHQTSQGLLSQSGHMLDELQTYLINRLQTENLIDVEYQNTLQALAELYCHGNHVDFSRLYNNSECQRLSLPVYPFQRLPLWYKEIEMEMSSEPLAGFYRPSWVPCTNTSDFTNIDQIIYLVANSATATLAESIQALLPANMAIITQCDDIHHIVFNKPCQIWYLADMAQSSNGHTGASMSKEVELIMQFFQALLESGHLTSPLNIKVITSNVYRIIGNDALHFAGASMHGLCQVAAKEYQHWQVGAIDVVSEELNDHHLLQCIFSTESRLQASYAIRGLVKYRQMLSSVPFAPTVAKHAFVKKGVYMLLGGAGRIGLTLCEHLVKNYSATVILIGRSKLTPAKKQQLAKLKRWPGNVIYQQVDITDEPAFKSTLLSLQETYKHFSGIFHTAMQYTETSLQHLTAEPLRQAIAVKVSPLKILHFMRHELSFDNVIVFSSAQSFHGNALRGAYTAACNVQDNLCDYLSVDMPIIVVNWGFWELASAPLNSQLHEYGITPINSRSGMKALEIMLNHAEKQIAFMQISPEIVKLMDISSGQSSIPVACGEAQSLHEDNIILQLQGLEELDEVIIKWLYLKFKMIGLLNDPSKQYSLTTLSQQLSVDDKGRVLLHSIFKLLAKCGYLKMIGETYMLVGEKVNSLTQTSDEEIQLEKCHLTRRYQVIEAHINLAYLCVQNIFAVLTRQRLATDVIFPGARSVLVDQIYMNNPLSDYFNLQVSETVFNYLKNFPDKSISILEIGTGTGATTQSVFKRLSTGLHQKIDYHLTDISEAILSNSRQHIVTPPALSTHYATLDISQNPSLQGFTSEQFDIIIASNVVHATKDLSVSIRHIKQLLKKGGALVLNECVTHSHFLSLTFGLLDGWWHYNDKSLRSDAGPLLSQSQWCNLLESHGFKTDVISDSLCNDQKVLISISDGLVAESETQRLSAASLATLTNTDIVTFNHTEQSILDFIADCLELDRKKIQHDTKLAALGIDSISAINLISALNTRYKLQFSIAELLQAENIKNLLSKMYNNNIIREVSA
jgi:acyl carrier protein/ubiquinone/menaquinone biosynthesis C-methylase UbiE